MPKEILSAEERRKLCLNFMECGNKMEIASLCRPCYDKQKYAESLCSHCGEPKSMSCM